jgi:hypothetical protein
MTLMELMLAVFVKVFTILYKWLHDYLVINIVNFVKGFEMAIVITVISFLLFNLFLTIKYLRKYSNVILCYRNYSNEKNKIIIIIDCPNACFWHYDNSIFAYLYKDSK